MLTFLNMDVEGFCSIESLHLQLNPTCTMLIKAPNGKGKSTILSALVWAIYGKNLKGVSEVNTWKQIRIPNLGIGKYMKTYPWSLYL